tara:strand:+ start:43 stop:294 length:252 start_codon:yes stop_codon:yes gene_type:complete
MSLNGFFDTLDSDAHFDVWKSTITSKLLRLREIIPIDKKIELKYIGKTINYINNYQYLDIGKKENISNMLNNCNEYYRKFGNQ